MRQEVVGEGYREEGVAVVMTIGAGKAEPGRLASTIETAGLPASLVSCGAVGWSGPGVRFDTGFVARLGRLLDDRVARLWESAVATDG